MRSHRTDDPIFGRVQYSNSDVFNQPARPVSYVFTLTLPAGNFLLEVLLVSPSAAEVVVDSIGFAISSRQAKPDTLRFWPEYHSSSFDVSVAGNNARNVNRFLAELSHMLLGHG